MNNECNYIENLFNWVLIQVIQVPKSITVSIENSSSTQINSGIFTEKNGPWIAALTISVLTILSNIYLSAKQRESANDLSHLQIVSSNQSKLNQDWINTFRITLSDFIFNSTILNNQVKSYKFDNAFVEKLESLIRQRSILSLMLENNDISKRLIVQLNELTTIISEKSSGLEECQENIIRTAREIIQLKSNLSNY